MEKELIEKLMALRKLNYAKLKKYEEELLQCKREVEVYESMIQIWGSVDPFNKKGGVI